MAYGVSMENNVGVLEGILGFTRMSISVECWVRDILLDGVMIFVA